MVYAADHWSHGEKEVILTGLNGNRGKNAVHNMLCLLSLSENAYIAFLWRIQLQTIYCGTKNEMKKTNKCWTNILPCERPKSDAGIVFEMFYFLMCMVFFQCLYGQEIKLPFLRPNHGSGPALRISCWHRHGDLLFFNVNIMIHWN